MFIGLLVLVAFAYADTGQLNMLENSYSVSLTRLDKAIAYIIAVLGLQVVVGYTGQLALGSELLLRHRRLPGGVARRGPALAVARHAGRGDPGVLRARACSSGIPALRIKGLYLALVTLGLAAIFPSIVQLDSLDEYTAGAAGKKVNSDIVAPSWLPLDGIASVFQNIPFFGQYFGDGDLSST